MTNRTNLKLAALLGWLKRQLPLRAVPLTAEQLDDLKSDLMARRDAKRAADAKWRMDYEAKSRASHTNLKLCAVLCTLLMLSAFMPGCAKTTIIPPGTPAPPSQLVNDVTLAVNAGDALVQALPQIPVNIKTEVQAGVTQLNAALACVQQVVISNVGGTAETLAGVKCGTSVNLSAFSAQAQQYLTTFNAAFQVVIAYFAPTAAPVTVTAADKTAVRALAKRTATAQKQVK